MDLHNLFLTTLVDSRFSLLGYPFTIILSGYGVAVVISSVVVYWLYIQRLFIREIPPPISVWVLWALLDVIATGAELVNGIFNVQLVTYTIGTTIVCFVLLRRLNTAWDKWWDTITIILVVASVLGWITAGDSHVGLIFSLTGMSISALPLLRAIIRGADEPLDAWIVIAIGSLLNFLDGKVLSSLWLGLLQIVIIVFILASAGKRKVAPS